MIETKRENYFAGANTGFWKPKNIFYTKEFTIAHENEGKEIWLEFEGIFKFGYVYVNDMLAGRCMYGYGNYYINITRFIEYGRTNIIKVVVKNDVMSNRWYSGAGIYRPFLYPAEPISA